MTDWIETDYDKKPSAQEESTAIISLAKNSSINTALEIAREIWIKDVELRERKAKTTRRIRILLISIPLIAILAYVLWQSVLIIKEAPGALLLAIIGTTIINGILSPRRKNTR